MIEDEGWRPKLSSPQAMSMKLGDGAPKEPAKVCYFVTSLGDGKVEAKLWSVEIPEDPKIPLRFSNAS